MNNSDRFNYLITQYTCGLITIPEQEELFDMITSSDHNNALSEFILHDLKNCTPGKDADLPPHISEEIIRNIFKAEKNISNILPAPKRFRIWRLVAAACIAGLIFSLYYFTFSSQKSSVISFKALIPDSAVKHLNNTGQTQLFLLPDGSRITLQPKSSVSYPKQFEADKREVYMQGGAFFQITRNPQKPFLVYYNNIVTKVLGTSFNINTNPNTGYIEVVVRTGKVQVYENEKLVNGKEQNNAVIITPNQKAIYKEEKRLFQTTLIETPQPVINEGLDTNSEAEAKETFIYEQEKLSSIFQHLVKKYGIEIVVENSNINDCLFTGDLSDNNLYNKLKIICLTTNASYEINGTAILIKGKGCN